MMVEVKKSSLVNSMVRAAKCEYTRYWFSSWWLLLVVLALLVVGLGLVIRLELIELESARWTLSALVQAGAALIGILFVAIGLLWNQANQEREKLSRLMEGYVLCFAPDTVAVIDLHRTLCEAYRTAFPNFPDFSQYSERVKMKLLKDVFKSLMVLAYTASRYLDVKVPSQKFFVGSPVEGLSSALESNYMLDAGMLCANEFRFFTYFMEFGDQLSLLADYLKLKDKGSPELAEILRRARSVDRVGVSLYRLRFFRAFTGGGLKVVSCMWLLCIATGMLILLSIDRIPPNLLSALAAIPVAIGIVAVGITLSLGLRAIRSA